jgi:uncharacterized protein YigA (DUF484 family)
MTEQEKPNTQHIVDYLSHHPEFFHEHLDLLESMTIPHPSGTATSLITKQLELSRSKYRELKTELNALIEIAKDNDTSSNRMHELTLALVKSQNVEEVVSNIDNVFSDCFLTDFSSVHIIRENADKLNKDIFVKPNAKGLTHFEKLFEDNQSICGEPTKSQAMFLFGAEIAGEIKSCAIIPLSSSGLKGIVAIGSKDETRFHYSMGNLFLTQMSETISSRLKTLLDTDER